MALPTQIDLYSLDWSYNGVPFFKGTAKSVESDPLYVSDSGSVFYSVTASPLVPNYPTRSVFHASFTIAYTDGSIASVEYVKDEKRAALIMGTADQFTIAKGLPKFSQFLQNFGIYIAPYLPTNVKDYVFRFNAVTVNGNVNIAGTATNVHTQVYKSRNIGLGELASDPDFIANFS